MLTSSGFVTIGNNVMRKPKHGEIWRHRDGDLSLIVDIFDDDIFQSLKSRLCLPRLTWCNVDTYDENGKHDALESLDLIELYYSPSEVEISQPQCNHNFIPAPIKKNSLWCKICGEYKPI